MVNVHHVVCRVGSRAVEAMSLVFVGQVVGLESVFSIQSSCFQVRSLAGQMVTVTLKCLIGVSGQIQVRSQKVEYLT